MTHKFLCVVVCVFFVVVVASGAPNACCLSRSGSYEVKVDDQVKIDYIKASSDYEYGLKAGRLYAGLIKVLPSLIRALSEVMEGEIRHYLYPADLYSDHIEYLEAYYPEHLKRMKGVERATAIPPQELMFIGASMGGCTTSASAPPATLGDEVLLTWNVDFLYDLRTVLKDASTSPEVDAPIMFGKPFFHIRDIAGHNKVFYFGIPGVLEMPILNDQGLAFVGNAISLEDEGAGLSAIEIVNKVMDSCSTVEEAAELINNSPRLTSSQSNLRNLNYLFADAKGGIASIEATHSYFVVKYGKETNGILAQANHHQWLDFRDTGAPRPPQPGNHSSTWVRGTRMWALLEDNQGTIDLEKAMSFTRDTKNGPEPGAGGRYSICRPGYRNETWGTIFAFVIQPRERVVWFCGARPDEAPYVKIDLSEYFGKDMEKIEPPPHVAFTPPRITPLEEIPEVKGEIDKGSLPPIVGRLAQLPLCASPLLNMSCSYCCPFDPTPCLKPIIGWLLSFIE